MYLEIMKKVCTGLNPYPGDLQAVRQEIIQVGCRCWHDVASLTKLYTGTQLIYTTEKDEKILC